MIEKIQLKGCMNEIKLEYGYKNPAIEQKLFKGYSTRWII
jgi:hypothetical protein